MIVSLSERKSRWREIQQRMTALGYSLQDDGDPGRLTLEAIEKLIEDTAKEKGIEFVAPLPALTAGGEYAEKWRTAVARDSDNLLWATTRIQDNAASYREVERATGVPWQVIAALHYREASLDFSKHLHNGDPLTARTVRVPAGLPREGKPPFSWVESAADALRHDKLPNVNWTDIDAALLAMERYNGMGYAKRSLPSPYLWSGTQHYRAGKFIRDGVYSATTVDKQLGVVPILKALGWG